MGVTHSSSRGAARLALVTNPPPAASDAPTGVPAGLRLLRSLDRSVLEVAREVELRPMELYALLLLSDAPEGESVTTRTLAGLLAASPSQAKQIALRLSARGFVDRAGAQGRTALTADGRKLAAAATAALGQEIARRLADIEADAVDEGVSALTTIVTRD
jgi:DNA-binding MarR family transcriptional regulator